MCPGPWKSLHRAILLSPTGANASEHINWKEKPVTLSVGQVLFVPAGKMHRARNPGISRGVEFVTDIVEKGKPLLVRAERQP